MRLADVLWESENIYNPTAIHQFRNRYSMNFDLNSDSNDELDIIFFNTLANKYLQLRQQPHFSIWKN